METALMVRLATIDPGALTARLVLEHPVEAADGQGGVERSFAARATLWANIEPVGAGADEAAGSAPVTVTHRVLMRRRSDLAGGMRLRQGARVLTIRTFRDPDEAGRYTLCDCEEVRP
jgi:SPP1 family predicted phage head-tail adaptor